MFDTLHLNKKIFFLDQESVVEVGQDLKETDLVTENEIAVETGIEVEDLPQDQSK